MAKEIRVPYKIKVGKGIIQTFYASEEKMRGVRNVYGGNSVKPYARFLNNSLDSLFIKVDNIKQANLALDILGLPQAFSTTESI